MFSNKCDFIQHGTSIVSNIRRIPLLGWFFSDNELFLEDTLSNSLYKDTLEMIPDIKNIIKKHQPDCPEEDLHFMMEFLLWSLDANKKLNKYRTLEGFQFKDSLGSYISGL